MGPKHQGGLSTRNLRNRAYIAFGVLGALLMLVWGPSSMGGDSSKIVHISNNAEMRFQKALMKVNHRPQQVDELGTKEELAQTPDDSLDETNSEGEGDTAAIVETTEQHTTQELDAREEEAQGTDKGTPDTDEAEGQSRNSGADAVASQGDGENANEAQSTDTIISGPRNRHKDSQNNDGGKSLCSKSKLGCKWDVVVVGSGIAGALLADVYARILKKKVLVLEEGEQIGGVFQDYLEERSGIRVHKYGLHVLQTADERVWNYMHRFSDWVPYEHRVASKVENSYYPTPINQETARKFDHAVTTLPKFQQWIEKNAPRKGTSNPGQTTKESIIFVVGLKMYELLFRDLYKDLLGEDLGKLDAELTAEVISIPAFFNYNYDDRRYPESTYQGVPRESYESMFEKMLGHENIDVILNTDYLSVKGELEKRFSDGKPLTFYTGSIDSYFKEVGANLEPLAYSPVTFEEIVEEQLILDARVGQPMLQVDHPQRDSKTGGGAITTFEFKHLYVHESNYTLVQSMYGKSGSPKTSPWSHRTVNYFLTPTPANKKLLNKYRALMEEEAVQRNVHFVANTGLLAHNDAGAGIAAARKVLEKVNKKADIDSFVDSNTAGKDVTMWDWGNGGKRVMKVQWVMSLYKESLSWMKNVCKYRIFHKEDVELSWVVYVKDESRSSESVLAEIHKSLRMGECDHDRVEVRRLKNVGRESHTNVAFLLTHQFSVGDAVIFTQPEMHCSVALVACRLMQVYFNFFEKAATKASDPANIHFKDVDWNARGRQGVTCNAYAQNMMQDIQKDTQAINHMLPLQRMNSIYALYNTHMKTQVRVLYRSYFLKHFNFLPRDFFYKAEFVVTEASIRRMLQRHRGWLWHELIPALATRDKPPEIYFVEGMWWHLFINHEQTELTEEMTKYLEEFTLLDHLPREKMLEQFHFGKKS